MNNLNILIIEDESLIALELSQTILNFGYHVVDYATTPKMALNLILSHEEIDLILMDINLNTTVTGIELYQKIPRKIPLIYLTAYRDEETISRAIATNPLGYLIKPIQEDELKALLKLAQLKLNKSEEKMLPKSHVTLGKGYCFDMNEERLFYKDIFLTLGKREIRLLKLLIEAKGNVVSFQTIEELVWEGEFVSSSALRTLIYRLRGKLEYQLIESVFNHGVKLVSF